MGGSGRLATEWPQMVADWLNGISGNNASATLPVYRFSDKTKVVKGDNNA
jgi:hypothetical protein